MFSIIACPDTAIVKSLVGYCMSKWVVVTPDAGSPYVPTEPEVAKGMLKLADVTSTDVVYDLGCGDGRVVIMAAKDFGAHGVGMDINPALIQQARANAIAYNIENLVRFEEGDLFNANLHNATVVTLYLLPDANLRLRPKLLSDLKPGARVVSHSFNMGNWEPEKEEAVDGAIIYLWTIPEKKMRRTNYGGGLAKPTRSRLVCEPYPKRMPPSASRLTVSAVSGRGPLMTDTITLHKPLRRLRRDGRCWNQLETEFLCLLGKGANLPFAIPELRSIRSLYPQTAGRV